MGQPPGRRRRPELGQLHASRRGRGGGASGGGGGQSGRNKKGNGQGAPPNPKNKGNNKLAAGAPRRREVNAYAWQEGTSNRSAPMRGACCAREGHTSANRPTWGRPMPPQMGHAISGGGFYNIELAEELKNLLDGSWDRRVAKVSEKEFSVHFPSRETLRMSTRRGKIYLL
ncbi:hypothetical protein QYE76_052540 [Lolium multiflorum]|uniref:Uncharacterized protein n=1 Tax=Lolium multiflorum TaxID=4521 RepID=A0AAD8SU39_LOLMU|nr:hypothetical protein QYE76_052540 [Lolium multiflorum]